MDWDNSFFIPKNNLFSKRWKNPDQIEEEKRLVNSSIEDNPCCSCGFPIGDVSEFFCEIDEKYYCSKCGSKLIHKNQSKNDSQKDVENLMVES